MYFLKLTDSHLIFLHQAGSTIRQMETLFKLVAFHLFVDESKRMLLRTELLKFGSRHESFLMRPVNKPLFHDHIKQPVLPNSWATQVEVIAVATMFSIPLYYCKMSEDNIKFCYWEMTYPIENAIVHDE